jgi:hypothetical protein
MYEPYLTTPIAKSVNRLLPEPSALQRTAYQIIIEALRGFLTAVALNGRQAIL